MKEVAFMSGEIKQIAERMRAVRIDSAYTYQEAAKLLEIPLKSTCYMNLAK